MTGAREGREQEGAGETEGEMAGWASDSTLDRRTSSQKDREAEDMRNGDQDHPQEGRRQRKERMRNGYQEQPQEGGRRRKGNGDQDQRRRGRWRSREDGGQRTAEGDARGAESAGGGEEQAREDAPHVERGTAPEGQYVVGEGEAAEVEEEGRRSKGIIAPRMVTKVEREEHERTHFP